MDAQKAEHQTVTLQGLEVHAFKSMDDILNAIIAYESGTVTPGFAVALNAEKMVLQERDEELRSSLRAATLRYADGAGVVWALRRRGIRARRLPGVELWERLMGRCAQHRTPLFLIGGHDDVLSEVEKRLKLTYPNINIVGTQQGYMSPAERANLATAIQTSGARVITVAMGSPRQEQLIEEMRQTNPDAFFMGCGGTYDVYTERVKRAPAWIGHLSAEWLYRFCRQPRRWRRTAIQASYALRIARNSK